MNSGMPDGKFGKKMPDFNAVSVQIAFNSNISRLPERNFGS